MADAKPGRCYCASCGAEIPSWFEEQPVSDEADDAAFERWLDTACTRCGRTPRQNHVLMSRP